MNLLLLFICLNVFLPLMTVEGLPFYNPDSCYYHAGKAPSADPAVLAGTTSDALKVEMGAPTNSTDPNNAPWDPITEPFEMLYSAGDTIRQYVLGGYVGTVIDHVAINCEMDPSTIVNNDPKTMRSVIGYIETNTNSPHYNQLITKYTADGSGGWIDNTCSTTNTASDCYQQNEVLAQFKTGVDLIMAFLIIFLIFYWITGKGHLITS